MLIHQLAAAGQSDRVLDLVTAGADPEATDALGATVLVAAARSASVLRRTGEPVDGQLAVVAGLLAHGVDAGRRDRFGRTAGDWLTGVPGADGVPGWRPAAAYPPYTSALLSLLRRDLGRREPAPVVSDAGQPAVVSELVSLFGDPPRVWLVLGYWSFEVRDVLLPGYIDIDEIELPEPPYDPAHSYQVGTGYFNEVLIMSWTPGTEDVRMWSFDVKDAYAYPDTTAKPLGTLEEFLTNLTGETVLGTGGSAVPDSGGHSVLRDLLACVDPPRFDPVPVPAVKAAAGSDDDSAPPAPGGIDTTQVELLGRYVLDVGELTGPLPVDHPVFPTTCQDIRAALLGLVAGGAVEVRARREGDEEVTLTLAEVIGDADLSTPGSPLWRPDAPHRWRLISEADYDRDLPDVDGRTVVPAPVEVDPADVDPDQVPQPAKDLLAFIEVNDEAPLGWLRPAVGTDSTALAATLAHARETVLDLYRTGMIEFLLADGIADDDVPALLAEDRYWAAWCDDVLVRTTPAGAEVTYY